MGESEELSISAADRTYGSFLEYVAMQYRHKKEDVATDLMAYLLQKHSVRKGFRELLKGLGLPNLPKRFRVRSRTGGVGGGIPDLVVIDADDEKVCALIENKFNARLTDKQPCEYLRELVSPSGLLLFVAPKTRQSRLWSDLLAKCEGEEIKCSEERIAVINLPGRTAVGQTGLGWIGVTSWDRLIECFEKYASEDTEVVAFVDQLRRICKVAELEEIRPLEASLIGNQQAAQQIYDYMRLAARMVEKARDDGHFKPTARVRKDERGETWVGYYGILGGFTAWIGFDPRAWSMRGISPIWIQFDDSDEIDDLESIFQSGTLGLAKFFKETYSGVPVLAIPVPLTPGEEEEVVLRKASTFVQGVKQAIAAAPAK